MKKNLINLGAALAMGVASFAATTAPAMARDGYHRNYDRGDYYRSNRGYRGDRYYRGDRSYRGDRYYRGGDRYYRSGYYRCRDRGTGGTIIGAIAGGLLGREVAGYGSRTEGAIIGAGVGALAGRAIDKGSNRC